MRGMEYRRTRAQKSLWLAVVISLLLHAAVLFINYSAPDPLSGQAATPTNEDNSNNVARPRLIASLTRQAKPVQTPPPPGALNTPSKPATASAKAVKQKKLLAPTGVWATRSWSTAERADMNKFLSELSTQAKPPSGQELSKMALATARQLGRVAQDGSEDDAVGQATANGKAVDPYSLEMYFDAFVRKMNRSAAFVKNDPRVRGAHKALVQISLNSDGSLKSYRVLRSGDQEAEIAYIKSVVERASPFSAFPPDIRKARDSLTIMMCIYPANAGGGGGFSRSFGDQDCKD